MDANIKNFLTNLLEEAGQKDLPADVHEQLLLDLNERLEQMLMITAVESLPEGKKAELDKMIVDKASQEDLDAFLKANLAGMDEVFKQTFEKFRSLYLQK